MSLMERVLVVPGAELDRLGRFQGFCREADRYLAELLVPRNATFETRWEVEDNPKFKQIIPYIVFQSGDRVFCYRRGSSQGESRLHQKRSLGVGGHVAQEDAQGRGTFEAYEMALRRELDEEVEIRSEGRMRLVGLINDDSTPVGSVHLGVVHLYELDRPEVSPREDGLVDSEFLDLPMIRSVREEFETWSRICIDALFSE